MNRFKPRQVESWGESQQYELDFWVNHWPYRHLDRTRIVEEIRRKDAEWFLGSMLFEVAEDRGYRGFRGTVLEVGCGPIGFFEAVPGVSVRGIDTLMHEYSTRIPFAKYGKVTNYDYSEVPLQKITEKFDFVVCSNVLDHTGDWKAFLKDCLGPLKPGTGELLLYTHCRTTPSPGHTQVFDPGEIVRWLIELGVRQIRHLQVRPDMSAHADVECFVRSGAPT